MDIAKKFLFALTIFFALNFSVANAEIITVEGTGQYIMNTEARKRAYELALLNATEQIDAQIFTYSRKINLDLDEDVIKTMTDALFEIVGELTYTVNKISEEHKEIICKITARVDTDKIEKLARLKSEGKQREFDEMQNQILIAKYERDLDIYDFGKKINLQYMMTTAEKLAALDAGNASAFRGIVYVYRHEDRIESVIDYCQKVLAANTSVELSIEACAQLGDIYYNEIFDTPTAKKYVDQGIALVKKKYSKAEIEKFVNGTNVEIKDLRIVGRSNTIRELYILKSDIENINPKFDTVSVMENLELIEDRICNIKYRTDW